MKKILVADKGMSRTSKREIMKQLQTRKMIITDPKNDLEYMKKDIKSNKLKAVSYDIDKNDK